MPIIERQPDDKVLQPQFDKVLSPETDLSEPVGPNYTTGDVFRAAFSSENLGGAGIKYWNRQGQYDFDVDPNGYNIYEDPDFAYHTNRDPGAFDGTVSKPHGQYIAGLLEETWRDEEILSDAGGLGMIASGVAGILDPSTFVPISVIGKSVKAGVAAARLAQGSQRATAAQKIFDLGSKIDPADLAKSVAVVSGEKGGLAAYPQIAKLHGEVLAKAARRAEKAAEIQRNALAPVSGGTVAISRTVAGGAVSNALAGTGQEAALQGLVTGRDDRFLVNTMVASAGFGALFGGFGGALINYKGKRLAASHEAMVHELTDGHLADILPDSALLTKAELKAIKPGTGETGEVIAAKAAAAGHPEQGRLVKTPVIQKGIDGLLHLSPSGRQAKSPFLVANQTGQAQLPTPFLRRGEGVIAISSKMKAYEGNAVILGDSVNTLRRGHNPGEFNRTAANLIRNGMEGAESARAEVREAAELMQELFEDSKKAFVAEGLIDEDVDLGADKGYFPRYPNVDEIENRRVEFEALIAPHEGGPEAAAEIAQSYIDRNGLGENADVFNFTQGESGRFKDRLLKNTPSELISDFLYDDPQYVMTRFARETGAQLEYAKAFRGDGPAIDGILMRPQKKALIAEAKEMIDKAPTQRAKNKLAEQRDKALEDMEFIRQSHLGWLDNDPFNALARKGVDATTAVTGVMLLDNAGFNSLGDVMGSAFVNGGASHFRTSWSAIKRPMAAVFSKMEPNQLAREARLMEITHNNNSRADLFFDSTNPGGGKPSKGINARSIHSAAMHLNGLRVVTATAKQFNVYSSQDALLRISQKVHKKGIDKLTKSEMNNLKLSGLTSANARAIGREIENGGAGLDGKAMLGNLGAWKDKELAQTFRAAVYQNVSRGVLTPEAGEIPKWARSNLGRLLFQFLSFPMAATNNFMVSGLQRRDANTYLGILAMTGMGMFIEGTNAWVRGENLEDIDLNNLVKDGFDRAGGPGILERANQVSSGLTKGLLDYSHLFGADTVVDRYGAGAGSLPASGAVRTIKTAAKGTVRLLNGEKMTDKEIRAYVGSWPLMKGIQAAPVNMLIQESLK